MSIITRDHLDQAMTYEEYRRLLDDLIARGQTTGPDHSPGILEFTRLNIHRMRRLEKTIAILPELSECQTRCKRSLVWLVLAEGWCGDVAQNLPVIAKVAEAMPTVQLRILLRDENLDIMDEFLTNGGRAIPKLICLDAQTLDPLTTWGPRPRPGQDMVKEFKADPEMTKEEFHKKLHLWYARDKGRHLQLEMLEMMKRFEDDASRDTA